MLIPDEVLARQAALQRRLDVRPNLPGTFRELCSQVVNALRKGSDLGVLRDPPHRIFAQLKEAAPPPEVERGAQALVGGSKNFHRSLDLPHFTRDDGGWFDFAITAREQNGALELLAYNFELRFPVSPPGLGQPPPPFVRFDLNPPGHSNADRGLRAHVHVGHDDLSVPAPILSPEEILDLLLYGLRLPADPRAS